MYIRKTEVTQGLKPEGRHIGAADENMYLMLSLKFMWDKYENHSRAVPEIPTQFNNLSVRMTWLIGAAPRFGRLFSLVQNVTVHTHLMCQKINAQCTPAKTLLISRVSLP